MKTTVDPQDSRVLRHVNHFSVLCFGPPCEQRDAFSPCCASPTDLKRYFHARAYFSKSLTFMIRRCSGKSQGDRSVKLNNLKYEKCREVRVKVHLQLNRAKYEMFHGLLSAGRQLDYRE